MPVIPLPILPADGVGIIPNPRKKAGKPTANAKVAGSRRVPLSHKENAFKPSDNSDNNDLVPSTKRRRRPSGSSNFLPADVGVLLNFIEQELPCGQHSWLKVHMKYNKWASKNRRPARTASSLETKYKQVSHAFIIIIAR